ncbi:MAG: hypothetical protein EHM20_09555 [Alphaproteobacteria bacterium]|nr:MAG: hypothetical protein EHM20_09555 [Alphaproteobacteria bacterium]
MSEFIEPGIYSSTRYMKFDLRFLAKPTSVNFTIVTPKTFYPRATMDPANSKKEFLEFEIKLDQDTSIIVGNLDITLLVEQEDLELSGFGVGIPKSSELSERRMLLYRSSPPPTYAYLTKIIKGTKHAINTHAVGLEQVFLRAHPNAEKPYLEVSITSYERITDLIKYHIEIPKILIHKFQTATERYTSPIYYTYRDDNIR